MNVLISLIISINVYQAVCNSVRKDCTFNNTYFANHKVFSHNADWKCYEYYLGYKYNKKIICQVEYDAQPYNVPGLNIDSECVPFDHKVASISSIVQSSLNEISNDSYDLWIKCCEFAERCCSQMMKNYQMENFFNTCDAHWNGIDCFEGTDPGKMVKEPCPYHLKKLDKSKCEYYYTKTCQPNGSWAESDYTQCYHEKRLKNFGNWHLIILGITLILCLPPILSFTLCKSCHGNHLKVLVALIFFVTLRSILKLTLVSLIYTDSMSLTENSFVCNTFAACIHFINNASYVCLSMVAFKLLQFRKNSTFESWAMFILMSFGLLLSILSIIFWSFIMNFYYNQRFWIDDNEYYWIYDAVRIVLVLVSAVSMALTICHQSHTYEIRMLQYTKIYIFPIIIFTLPIILNTFSLLFGRCGWEEILKFTKESFELLQVLALSLIYFIPIPFKSWSSAKVSSQNSNASLAPSRQSLNRDGNWQDVVIFANSTACYDNEVVYENISTLPEPYKADNNENVNYIRNHNSHNNNHQRHTIRQVMQRAKKNLPNDEIITPNKYTSLPVLIPKIIPNQILDDVQLFDAYYKSLDSSSAASESIDQSESNKKEAQKRLSIKNIGKSLISRSSQHKSIRDDAASNDI